MIFLYLVAIVLANLSVAYFGAGAAVINAFLFIGLDLTARDKLHNAWRNKGLVWKMGALIACGSLLTWALNRNAGQVALASVVAFSAAAIIDTAVYHKTGSINKSNVASAIVDSVLFPWIAFGGFMPLVTIGQSVAKIGGGALWAFILAKRSANA